MSPSGPPVTTYCMRADAPGRSGWPSASLRVSSTHSWLRYFDMTFPLVAGRSSGADGCAQAGEEVVLHISVGNSRVDQRTCEHELLPREDLAYDLVRQTHPEPGRIDLRAVREQGLAALVQEVAHVDERGEAFVDRVVETLSLKPLGVRALLAPSDERVVEGADTPGRPPGVIHLQRLPRLAQVGKRVRVAGGVERRSRDLVHPDVVRVR